MNGLLDLWIQIAWRVTWQSALLAILVALLAVTLRERIAPRWLYLLWCVVLLRLLVVVTPASPWSAFNLLAEQSSGLVKLNRTFATSVRSPDRPNDFRQGMSVERSSVESSADRQVNPVIAPQSAEARGTPHEKRSQVDRGRSREGSRRVSDERARQALLGPVIALLWCAGCLFIGVRYGIAWRALRRLLADCQPVTDSATLQLLDSAKSKLGFRRSGPQLLISSEPTNAFVTGTVKPRIVVPASLFETMPTQVLEFVFAHELAHIRRRDIWVQWLLVAIKTLHWFNPFAWWTSRQMQATREAACDDLVVERYGASYRTQYARTIVTLSAHAHPAPLAAGLIGFFHRKSVVLRRVRRLADPPAKRPRALASTALVAAFALAGLTDATAPAPNVSLAATVLQGEGVPSGGHADKESGVAHAVDPEEPNGDFAIAGQCLTRTDRSPLAGVTIRLLATRGLLGEAQIIAATQSDAEGNFQFEPVPRPNPLRMDSLFYALVGETAGRPVQVRRIFGHNDPSQTKIHFYESESTVQGRVVDENGIPIEGAIVRPAYYRIRGTVPGLATAETNFEGRFEIARLPPIERDANHVHSLSFLVGHPRFPSTILEIKEPREEALCVLPRGCTLSGSVLDKATREPMAGVIVTAAPMQVGHMVHAVTDAQGQYRIVVSEGNYSILLEDSDVVADAIADIECWEGTNVELNPLLCGPGGWITGRVLTRRDGEPMSRTNNDQRIEIGLFGPNRPAQTWIGPAVLALVDDEGNFRLRAAAGENYPYSINLHSDRMTWNTHKLPPVVVDEGATTPCMLHFSTRQTPTEKLTAAREVIGALPEGTEQRVDAIIEEFRKLNHTVDQTETWCMLMRELTYIGSDAVTALCQEFEATSEPRMIRRLAFALRAIGDPRAVPTLIRAIPKTLLPPSSDYGLIVEDLDLAAFMREHSIEGRDGRDRGKYFGLGRAVRETHAALTRLTNRDVDGSDLFGMTRSQDSRSLARQEQYYHEAAEEWAAWWETNWDRFAVEASFREVNLPAYRPPESSDFPTGRELSKNATVAEGLSGMVLSPLGDADKSSTFFLDLDTGRYDRGGPKELSHFDGSAESLEAAKAWARKESADLICVALPDEAGVRAYTLVGIELQLWEIHPLDAKNIAKRIADGKLPEGREVEEALTHFDTRTEREVSKPGSSFLYVTAEDGLGVITVTDIVTEVRDLTGSILPPPKGVGFNRGVRFDYHPIAR